MRALERGAELSCAGGALWGAGIARLPTRAQLLHERRGAPEAGAAGTGGGRGALV